MIEQKLPPGLSYVPESVRMFVGGDPSLNGNKTDKPGDDQVGMGTRRPGRCGFGLAGRDGQQKAARSIRPTRRWWSKYQVKIDDRAYGELPPQSTTTATPVGGVSSGPILFPSGNGVTPNAPTIVVVPPCVSNDDCSPGTPVCDKSGPASAARTYV